jgi:hypothetical protein
MTEKKLTFEEVQEFERKRMQRELKAQQEITEKPVIEKIKK